AGDRARERIGCSQRLAVRSLQHDAKGVATRVRGEESIVGGQGSLGVTAAKVHRAGIAGGDVTVWIFGGDRDIARRPGGAGRSQEIGSASGRDRGLNSEATVASGDRDGEGVRGGQGLVSDTL